MRKDKKMARKVTNLQIVFVVMAIAATSLFWIGPYLYRAYAQFSVRNTDESVAGSIPSGAMYYSAPRATTPAATSSRAVQVSGANIANNGLIILRGARVISSSDGVIHVVTAWNSVSFLWEIQTRIFTEFITSKGEKETPAEVRVGDMVIITGDLIQGGAEPVVSAQFVRKY
ncbi:MAG: hypothetical protein V1856_02315 [Candidatus Liptonbacteria bacterium]